jgi:hypothetical protein
MSEDNGVMLCGSLWQCGLQATIVNAGGASYTEVQDGISRLLFPSAQLSRLHALQDRSSTLRCWALHVFSCDVSVVQ